MKVLCLHGHGTSGRIMEMQFADFCQALNPSYEYVFLDGEAECERPKALGDLIPGPFYCYYKGMASAEISDACDLLYSVVAEEGPFDGVIGFSQGASLALSFLLQHEISKPDTPPPFKWAVFFSPMLAASPDHDFLAQEVAKFGNNVDLSALEALGSTDAGVRSAAKKQQRRAMPDSRLALVLNRNKRSLAQEIVDLLTQAIQGANEIGVVTESSYVDNIRRGAEGFPRVFHPLALTQRVSIPNVHVVGRNDNEHMIRIANLMRKLCQQELTKCVEHAGLHDVPRNDREIGAAVAATEWAITMSRLAVPRL